MSSYLVISMKQLIRCLMLSCAVNSLMREEVGKAAKQVAADFAFQNDIALKREQILKLDNDNKNKDTLTLLESNFFDIVWFSWFLFVLNILKYRIKNNKNDTTNHFSNENRSIEKMKLTWFVESISILGGHIMKSMSKIKSGLMYMLGYCLVAIVYITFRAV